MRIAICDDMKKDREILKNYFFQYANEQNIEFAIDEYGTAEELVAALAKSRVQPAIVFLDIYMEKMCGIDAAKLIYKNGFSGSLIFTTASQDHAVLSYDIGADGYLKKPFEYASFLKTMLRCRHKWADSLKTLTVYSNRLEFRILLQKIEYIESCAHGSMIHAEGQKLKTRKFLSELEQSLKDEKCFIRCGRSFMINMNAVCGQQDDGSVIHLKSGGKIFIPVRERVRVNGMIAEYYWAIVRRKEV